MIAKCAIALAIAGLSLPAHAAPGDIVWMSKAEFCLRFTTSDEAQRNCLRNTMPDEVGVREIDITNPTSDQIVVFKRPH